MEILMIVMFLAAVAFYFLPSLIAFKRNVHHDGAIGLVNLIFGWTILGWIAALIWAVVEKSRD